MRVGSLENDKEFYVVMDVRLYKVRHSSLSEMRATITHIDAVPAIDEDGRPDVLPPAVHNELVEGRAYTRRGKKIYIGVSQKVQELLDCPINEIDDLRYQKRVLAVENSEFMGAIRRFHDKGLWYRLLCAIRNRLS